MSRTNCIKLHHARDGIKNQALSASNHVLSGHDSVGSRLLKAWQSLSEGRWQTTISWLFWLRSTRPATELLPVGPVLRSLLFERQLRHHRIALCEDSAGTFIAHSR